MTRRPFASLLAALALATLTALPTAHAQSPEEINIARQTAVEGLSAYKAGELDKALRLFEEAKAIYPSAQILRMYGYSLLGLEKWEQAADALQAALDSKVGPLGDADAQDVRDNLAKANAHLVFVTVTASAPGAELVVDDKPAQKLPLDQPLRLLEGRHTFLVRAPDRLDASQEMSLEGGKTMEFALEPREVPKEAPPPPPPPPKPKPKPRQALFPHQREIGFAAAGAGVVMGGAALVTALVGAHIRGNVSDDVARHDAQYPSGCTGANARLCLYDVEVVNHDADRADTLRDASVWLGVGAGVLAAGGVALVLLTPRTEAAPAPSVPEQAKAARARSRGGVSLACGPLGLGGVTCGGAF